MGTTSNYSFPYPESSDYVADGATAFENLADAVDTTVHDHRGLQLIESRTISAQNYENFESVFVSDIHTYRVVFDSFRLKNSNSFFYIRMMSGSTLSTDTHYWNYLGRKGSAGANTSGSSTTGGFTGTTVSAGHQNVWWGNPRMEIAGPNLGTRTSIFIETTYYYNDYAWRGGAIHVDTGTVFDGFQLHCSGTDTFDANVYIYGYEQ